MGKLASAPPNQVAQFRSDGFNGNTGLRVPFHTDTFSRGIGLPDSRLINMVVEATPIREESVYRAPVGLREVHYSRPGLSAFSAAGGGPVRGLFSAPGVFAGDFFQASGGTFYKGVASWGTCAGADRVRFAASRTQVVGIANGTAYLFTDGASSFAPIVSAVLPPVSDVAYLSSRFVYVCQNSDTFYYSDILNASSINGLNFATAESYPDKTVAVGVLNEELVFFGQNSVEFWQVSSDPAAPFIPITGRGFQRGCVARDSVAFADNSLFWVANNLVVYRVGSSAPQRISSSSIEDKLRQCSSPADITGWSGTFDGHEFYVINIPGVGSFAYDCSRLGFKNAEIGEWAEWASFGRTTFRGQNATTSNGVTYVGDDTTGTIWKMDPTVFTDGSDPLCRTLSAFIKVEEGTPRCNNLVIHGEMGVGNAVDPGASPVIEMRWSDDLGHTFTNWRTATLGKRGAYYTRAYWQRLDCMRAPGRLVEVRVSDPVRFTASSLELNATRPAT